MKYAKYPVKPFRLDDEPSEEKEDKPQTDPGMLMKKPALGSAICLAQRSFPLSASSEIR